MSLYPRQGVTLRGRRVPRQARSLVTVAAILDATVLVLLEHGYDGCSTRLVAEVAGVGVGSLYEYFPNKEALIAALVAREADRYMEALQRTMAASSERPFAEALRCALAGALHELETRRELLRILLTNYPYVGQVAALGSVPGRAAELAAVCLGRWGDQVHVSNNPAAYHVLANMLIGACVSQVLHPSAQVSNEAMLDALVEILLRILQPHG